MIDLHSHILWEIDDGAKDKEMTINMLKKAEESGTKVIVATPHYLMDRYDVKYSDLQKRFKEIKALIEEENINLEVYLGQEVYFCDNILDLYNNNEIGTINGGKYMLVELPMNEFDVQEVIDKLYELQVRGINIIIAHPERYKPFISNVTLINKFIDEGYLFQLNGGSVIGNFGKDVQKLSEKLLEKNIYNFIGSDAHRDSMRTTDLSQVIDAINKINSSALDLFEESGRTLINNEDVEFDGSKIIKEKKGLFSFFR